MSPKSKISPLSPSRRDKKVFEKGHGEPNSPSAQLLRSFTWRAPKSSPRIEAHRWRFDGDADVSSMEDSHRSEDKLQEKMFCSKNVIRGSLP